MMENILNETNHQLNKLFQICWPYIFFFFILHFFDTVYPRLDALHVLDTSARFDARWSGRNTF